MVDTLVRIARVEGPIHRADQASRASRLLGFQATSSPLRSVIEHEIDRLIGHRLLIRNQSGQLEVPRPSSKPTA